MALGSFVKSFPAITQGELEPQFASKDSYFEQNIKQVCRSNWEVKKHKLAWYLIYIIIHVPSEKIWKHLGHFGGLDIKTSQEPKLWKKWKIGHFNQIQKRDITVVSEHDLGTWCGLIFMITIIQWPPLYIKTQKCFCWRGEKK